jgi:hypothetical protein
MGSFLANLKLLNQVARKGGGLSENLQYHLSEYWFVFFPLALPFNS